MLHQRQYALLMTSDNQGPLCSCDLQFFETDSYRCNMCVFLHVNPLLLVNVCVYVCGLRVHCRELASVGLSHKYPVWTFNGTVPGPMIRYVG
jgi:hypothetical protein